MYLKLSSVCVCVCVCVCSLWGAPLCEHNNRIEYQRIEWMELHSSSLLCLSLFLTYFIPPWFPLFFFPSSFGSISHTFVSLVPHSKKTFFLKCRLFWTSLDCMSTLKSSCVSWSQSSSMNWWFSASVPALFVSVQTQRTQVMWCTWSTGSNNKRCSVPAKETNSRCFDENINR